jgi:2-hydroxy-3-keto-5-methylthiopentenyl-1-phosphate phosphatase
MTPSPGTVVQCDFDGTITHDDVAFVMLAAHAKGDWRKVHDDYEAARITVGRFNQAAFDLVRATRRELLASMEGKVAIRAGFAALVDCCRRRGFRLVVVSNGLEFYIRHILGGLGFPEIEVHAAQARFHGRRVSVQYVGPDGTTLDDAFKEAYVSLFRDQGYRVIYVGNGASDYFPAKKAHRVFATATLLRTCEKAHLECIPFDDFNDVARVLETL